MLIKEIIIINFVKKEKRGQPKRKRKNERKSQKIEKERKPEKKMICMDFIKIN